MTNIEPKVIGRLITLTKFYLTPAVKISTLTNS